MDNEIKAQIDKHTWEPVTTPPPDVDTVESKWTYCCKKHQKGSTLCPKSHLVVQGLAQTFGVD